MPHYSFEEFRSLLQPLRSSPLEAFDVHNIPASEISSGCCDAPQISIVTTAYNHAHCLPRALDSVLAQKINVPFEILLGEDCSTDGTPEIAREYQRRYPHVIRLITSEQNCNQGNLARLLLKARGKYVAILEGDDFWHRTDKLQLQYDLMEAHPECSWCASDSNKFFQCDGHTDEAELRRRGLLDVAAGMDAKAQLMETRFWLDTCTIFARAAMLQEAYLHEEIFSYRLLLTDLAIRITLSMKGKLAFIPESLATYRINTPGGSACRIRDPHKALDFLLDAWLISEYFAPDVLDESEQRQLVQRFARGVCARCSNILDRQLAHNAKALLKKLGCRLSWKDRLYLAMGSYPALYHMMQRRRRKR